MSNSNRIEILVNDSIKERLEELRKDAEASIGSRVSMSSMIVTMIELFLESSDPISVLSSQTTED